MKKHPTSNNQNISSKPNVADSLQVDLQQDIEKILSYSMNNVDFNAAKKLCESYFYSPQVELKRISIICVGHLARVYRKLVDDKIIAEIIKLSLNENLTSQNSNNNNPDNFPHKDSPSIENNFELSNNYFFGCANDALDDIEIFVDPDIRKFQADDEAKE